MAEVKIYRAAYLYGEEDDARIVFSKWVQSDGIDEVLEDLPAATPAAGLPPQTVVMEPELIGWEEKTLDTDPV